MFNSLRFDTPERRYFFVREFPSNNECGVMPSWLIAVNVDRLLGYHFDYAKKLNSCPTDVAVHDSGRTVLSQLCSRCQRTINGSDRRSRISMTAEVSPALEMFQPKT